MSVLSLVVFIPLQIVFLPLGVLGALLVAYKQMVVSKKLGVSQTAIEILNGRWTMHVFGMRDDDPAVRLANSLPNTSTFGLWLFLLPLWVKYKLSGSYFLYPRVPEVGKEAIADLVPARTLYFDRIIERAVRDVEQFVVMGAGFDTRAYGAFEREGLRFFELDQIATQDLKRDTLRKAGVDTSHVTFIGVDFAMESVFQKLRENGYDPNKKTLFLWEGVTLYLNEVDVRKTLQDIRANAAPGSVVVADIYGERMLRVGSNAIGKKALEYTDEGFGFGLTFATDWEDSLDDFIASEQMTRGEAWFLGSGSPKGPFVVVAELGV
ncbi:MAG: SAM-dependent methyltransferase [Myxococcota bacterium]|nr:SAM-dependent methyltransferase [Myxococcota bacterium]